MKRLLYILLALLIAVLVSGCDSLLGSNKEEITPPIDTTGQTGGDIQLSASAEDKLVTPRFGKSVRVTIEAFTENPNSITALEVRNAAGALKKKVRVPSLPSVSRSWDIEIQSLDDRELVVEAKGLSGTHSSVTLELNVSDKIIPFTAQDPENGDRAGLYNAPVEGGKPVKLFTYTEKESPVDQVVFLPDGNYMTFDFQPGSFCNRIYTISYDGEVVKDWGEDCRFFGSVIDAELSPNGGKIAFVSGAPHVLQVFTWDLVSDEVVQLTEGECTRFDIPVGMDSCLGGVFSIAYHPDTGELYASVHGWKRKGENGKSSFTVLSLLSKTGDNDNIVSTFPDGLNARISDIHGNTAVFEARGEDGTRKGLLFYDLETGQWDIRDYNSWQFNFAPDGTGVAVHLGTGAGNQLAYFDKEGRQVGDPVYVDDVWGIQNPHVVPYREN